MSDLPPELKRKAPAPADADAPPPLTGVEAPPELTTDSWPNQKILKYIFFRKPKGSPRAGKKEMVLRATCGVVGAVMAYFLIFGSSALPTCNSGKTKDVVEKIINGLPLARAGNTKYVTLKDVEETGYNKNAGIRGCSATLITTAGEDSLVYSVTWQDSDRKGFLVRAQIQ
ncbi:MAG: hypothetical protein PSV40_15680 [Polaromonas sp.]|uniref:hypothetical protein n=1 Tax=Polaromonas sp. TaxID=1869339 RepID=UPI0024892222|nr:hypothetical protein [Polaromonas sp.]MDI1270528.1 hypothetical protein [Polaromonas sp.]